MDDDSAWDPEDKRQRPLWTTRQVLTVLDGVPVERTQAGFARGKRSNALYPIAAFAFGCGCIARSDSGWSTCAAALHQVLARESPTSPRIAHFQHLRGTFNAVLLEAWRRSDAKVEQYIDFQAHPRLRRIDSFAEWQKDHDLLGQPVWQREGLYADLTPIPLERRIRLYNGGAWDRPAFILDLHDERSQRVVRLDADRTASLQKTFGGGL